MDDSKIIDLYWQRDEKAIEETDSKYGAYCRAVSMNILGVREDAEECVSDTYARVWNAMPPERPGRLRAWLAGITRNLSIDRWRRERTHGRGSTVTVLLSELEECVSSPRGLEEITAARELGRILNGWLKSLTRQDCADFMLRYWGGERGGYRGETVSYRLGYIIDDRCNNAESVYLYCIRDTGGQLSACYIPVVEQ